MPNFEKTLFMAVGVIIGSVIANSVLNNMR